MIEIKDLLFTITKKDFRVDYYKAPGAGGQKKNKTETACRITHMESGAIGNAVEERSQLQNKKKAFERLVASDKFKKWHKAEVARRLGKEADIEEIVNQQMQDKYLKIEYIGGEDS